MKATQAKSPVIEQVEVKKCVICNQPTIGWGRVSDGVVCSGKCQYAHDRAVVALRMSAMSKT